MDWDCGNVWCRFESVVGFLIEKDSVLSFDGLIDMTLKFTTNRQSMSVRASLVFNLLLFFII